MKTFKNVKTRSLSQILGNWEVEIPGNDHSSVQLRSYKLYNTQIKQYNNGDLRFMIGQEFGLQYLIPLAINILKDNPFIETEYYDGDLLNSVLSVPKEFWHENKRIETQLNTVLDKAELNINQLDMSFEIDRKLKENISKFRKI